MAWGRPLFGTWKTILLTVQMGPGVAMPCPKSERRRFRASATTTARRIGMSIQTDWTDEQGGRMFIREFDWAKSPGDLLDTRGNFRRRVIKGTSFRHGYKRLVRRKPSRWGLLGLRTGQVKGVWLPGRKPREKDAQPQE